MNILTIPIYKVPIMQYRLCKCNVVCIKNLIKILSTRLKAFQARACNVIAHLQTEWPQATNNKAISYACIVYYMEYGCHSKNVILKVVCMTVIMIHKSVYNMLFVI